MHPFRATFLGLLLCSTVPAAVAAGLPPAGQACMLVPAADGLALSVSPKAGADRSGVFLSRINAGVRQRFTLVPTGDRAVYFLRTYAGGRCLAAGPSGTLYVTRDTGARWRVIPSADGTFRLLDASSGLALTRTSGVAAANRRIAVMMRPALAKDAAQAWRLRAIAGLGLLVPRDRGTLAALPLVDVHVHGGGFGGNRNFVRMREVAKARYGVDIGLAIDLNGATPPRGTDAELRRRQAAFGLRILPCLHTAYKQRLSYTPDQITKWAKRGVAGYKIWWGNSTGIAAAENMPVYARMAELGLPVASAHIGKGGGAPAAAAQDAWERVLAAHPKLVVVTAHMGNLFYGKNRARLERMFATYPNYHVDISWGMGSGAFADREGLRAFFIKHADRLVFGTDVKWHASSTNRYEYVAAGYEKLCRVLETDEWVMGTIWLGVGNRAVRGLALPREVLEKIYFRNAMRIYPGVRQALVKLGYRVD